MKSLRFLTLVSAAVTTLLAACNAAPKTENNASKSDSIAVIPAFDTNSLDRRYRPQDDFDSFVNGGWKKNNPVPATEGNWGAFGIIDKENSEVKLKGIIDGVLKTKDHKAGSDEQRIADMYTAFMDSLGIEQQGLKPLNQYISQIMGVSNLADWIKINGELQRIGVSSVLGVYVDADDRNSAMNAVKWGQSGLSLGEKSYYSGKDERMQTIRTEFVAHVNQIMGLSQYFDSVQSGKRLLDFESQLATCQLSNVELRDPIKTYNKLHMNDLKSLSKNCDWSSFSVAQGIQTDSIIVQNKAYFTKLNTLLSKTDVNTLKLFTYYKLISSFSKYLPAGYKNEFFHFYGQVKGGIKQQKTRAIQAIDVAESLGEGNILGRLYTKAYFPESSKKKVAEMIENVRAVFSERVKTKLPWMTDNTKTKALEKLSTFVYKIGYPDQWEDYSKIAVNKSTLIENIISNTLWSHNKMLKDVGAPVDKKRWLMPPQTVNAYYNPLNNEIVFPAGILQAPFFNPTADDAINYGGIIAVIGHEFTHGFDDQGAQYDAKGNLKNWWSEEDAKNFKTLGDQYITYFNQFEPLKGIHVNGALTIGENIADLGGITLAYYALKKSLEGKPEPAKIDGFTWQQRFFLSWAQVWHNNIKDEELRNRLQTDPHSPARYRINGPLKHFQPFYEAFGIKEGDKMWIPENQRVVIW
jgi:predicted metalloendopeptidase